MLGGVTVGGNLGEEVSARDLASIARQAGLRAKDLQGGR